MASCISKQGILHRAKKFIRIAFVNMFYLDRKIIFEVDLKNETAPKQSIIPIKFQWGTKEDILAMDKKTYRYNEKGKKYSIERMKKGDKILLAIHNSRVIGYQAFMSGAMELTPARHLKLPPLTIYFYKGFVVREARNKGVMDNMLGFIIKVLKQEHYDKGIGVVLMQNKPMLKVMNNLGFKPLGTILLFRFFGYETPVISGKTLRFLKSGKIDPIKTKPFDKGKMSSRNG
jgi:GNAT superfamily N-acetyltransferase